MKIELLHIDECPNTATALEHLQAALIALHRTDIPINSRLLKSSADTAGTGFAGSPTITADGADMFPEAAPSSDLACRIYRTPEGHAGAPTVGQLVEALRNRGL